MTKNTDWKTPHNHDDNWKPTPHRDSITGKVTNGHGGSYDISSKIEKAQRQRPNPSR